eukprot:NODE_264_length_1082_cov_218.129719_g223_i0.p1 GENE.NODE_264_length_1082_cov_218.129719_g223_i0~~NODE_264_length_1082_cov_218.129719_g223_i0.p1  ORF type:complete len:319 (+),score=68.32 NODE_264_length_1082_cov_218.129719_g223_i0:66-1022(+)
MENKVLKLLGEMGIHARKEENVDPNVKRPVGHHTHNLVVKDKKKNAVFVVTLRQEVHCDMKDLTKRLGMKELRLATADVVKELLGVDKGCITSLSMANATPGSVTWVVDEGVLELPSLRICSGCTNPLDHTQHQVVDITPAQLLTLLGKHEPMKLKFAVSQETVTPHTSAMAPVGGVKGTKVAAQLCVGDMVHLTDGVYTIRHITRMSNSLLSCFIEGVAGDTTYFNAHAAHQVTVSSENVAVTTTSVEKCTTQASQVKGTKPASQLHVGDKVLLTGVSYTVHHVTVFSTSLLSCFVKNDAGEVTYLNLHLGLKVALV